MLNLDDLIYKQRTAGTDLDAATRTASMEALKKKQSLLNLSARRRGQESLSNSKTLQNWGAMPSENVQAAEDNAEFYRNNQQLQSEQDLEAGGTGNLVRTQAGRLGRSSDSGPSGTNGAGEYGGPSAFSSLQAAGTNPTQTADLWVEKLKAARLANEGQEIANRQAKETLPTEQVDEALFNANTGRTAKLGQVAAEQALVSGRPKIQLEQEATLAGARTQMQPEVAAQTALTAERQRGLMQARFGDVANAKRDAELAKIQQRMAESESRQEQAASSARIKALTAILANPMLKADERAKYQQQLDVELSQGGSYGALRQQMQ